MIKGIIWWSEATHLLNFYTSVQFTLRAYFFYSSTLQRWILYMFTRILLFSNRFYMEMMELFSWTPKAVSRCLSNSETSNGIFKTTLMSPKRIRLYVSIWIKRWQRVLEWGPQWASLAHHINSSPSTRFLRSPRSPSLMRERRKP